MAICIPKEIILGKLSNTKFISNPLRENNQFCKIHFKAKIQHYAKVETKPERI